MPNASLQELPPLPAGSNQTQSGNQTYASYQRSRPTKRWHEAIIDDLLAAPLDTLKDRAARLGYSEAGLGSIIRSDMFVAAYGARRAHYTEVLDQALSQKLAKLGDTMLTVMQESVDSKRTQIPFAVLTESTMGVLEKLGFGAKNSGPSTVVNVQQNGGASTPVISAERLSQARDRLRMVESQNGARQLEAPGEARPHLMPRDEVPSADAARPVEGGPQILNLLSPSGEAALPPKPLEG